MTDRPIIFSGPMVRALLDGRKTQTRRILKRPQWAQEAGWPERIMDEQGLDGRLVWYDVKTGCLAALPIPQPQDRLYVREAHALVPASAYRQSAGVAQAVNPYEDDQAAIYREGFDRSFGGIRWRPSIHMPRWSSRITLPVTEVRVQRLQDISEEDAIAEGCRPFFDEDDAQAVAGPKGTEFKLMPLKGPIDAFRRLWNSLHGDDAWDANPWVCATSFELRLGNIDRLEAA